MILWLAFVIVLLTALIGLLRHGFKRGGASLYATLYLSLPLVAFLGKALDETGLFGSYGRYLAQATVGGIIPCLGMAVWLMYWDFDSWSLQTSLEFIRLNRLTVAAGPILGVVLAFRHDWAGVVQLLFGAVLAWWLLGRWQKRLMQYAQA